MKYDLSKFRYKTTFSSKIETIVPEDNQKFLAKASLESLKQLLPANINPEDNPDLLYTSCNLFVANLVNANHDGMLGKDALSILSKLPNKFADLEHDQSKLVGHIISAGLSTFPSNKYITAEELSSDKDLFNVAICSVIYSYLFPEFCELIEEASDITSPKYHSVSASWEIAFDNYIIAVGSRHLGEAELVTDPAKIKELSKFLRAEGGTGMTNNNEEIYRVVAGEIIPIGFGFTTSPAAEVEGVVAIASNQNENNETTLTLEIESKSEEIDTSTDENEEKNEKNKKIISQLNNNDVVKDKMKKKLTDLAELTDDSLPEYSAASITSFILDEIRKGNEIWKEQESEKEEALSKANEKATQLEAELTQAKNSLTETQNKFNELEIKFNELKDKQDKLDKDTTYNIRLATLDEEFELTSEDREVIAKSIYGLDDEAYSEWKKGFDVLAKEKNKEVIAKKKETATASSLENATPKNQDLPPNAPHVEDEEETIAERMAKAFSKDNILIKNRK